MESKDLEQEIEYLTRELERKKKELEEQKPLDPLFLEKTLGNDKPIYLALALIPKEQWIEVAIEQLCFDDKKTSFPCNYLLPRRRRDIFTGNTYTMYELRNFPLGEDYDDLSSEVHVERIQTDQPRGYKLISNLLQEFPDCFFKFDPGQKISNSKKRLEVVLDLFEKCWTSREKKIDLEGTIFGGECFLFKDEKLFVKIDSSNLEEKKELNHMEYEFIVSEIFYTNRLIINT